MVSECCPATRFSRLHPQGGTGFGSAHMPPNCTWPMHRVPRGTSFDYKCGLYQQSHGQCCAHNHIDGLLATRFVLACLGQRLHSPAVFEKLKARLRQLAAEELQRVAPDRSTAASQAQLVQLRHELKLAERNLAFAENEPVSGCCNNR